MNERIETTPYAEIANNMHGKIKRSATAKNIYVQDLEFWEQCKAFAEERGLSMSELLLAGAYKLMNDKCPVCKRIAEVLNTGSGIETAPIKPEPIKPETVEVPAEFKAKPARKAKASK